MTSTLALVRSVDNSSAASRGRTRDTNSHQPPLQEQDGASRWQRLLAVLPDELDGNYSVARLDAFNRYRVTTHKLWLVFVLIATPLPMQIAVSGIYSIPLESPERGWRSNKRFFLQVFCGSVLVTTAAQWQRSYYFATRSKKAWYMNTVVALVIATFFTSIVLMLAVLMGFPVPFGLFLPLVVAFPFNYAILRWVRRARKNNQETCQVQTSESTDRGKASREKQLRVQTKQQDRSVKHDQKSLFAKYRKLVLFNAALIFVYPLYMVGFRAFKGHVRIAYMVLLPILKVILIVFCRKRLDHVQDLAAASTVFSVELMNAMFSALCMGGATSSRSTLMVMMVIDVANLGVSMLRLLYKTRNMSRILQETNEQGQRITFENMIQWSLSFARTHCNRLKAEKDIRWRASNDIQFSRNMRIIRMLQHLGQEPPQTLIPRSHFLRSRQHTTSNTLDLTAEESKEVECNQIALLREVLAFMFMIEYLVLVEYVEAVIPMMLALYYTIVYYGPNCRFNLDLMDMEESRFHESIVNMMVYGTLEWLSLVLFFWLIRRRFKVNMFDCLGFVLETHFLDIQGKIGFFLANIISERFFHYGNLCPASFMVWLDMSHANHKTLWLLCQSRSRFHTAIRVAGEIFQPKRNGRTWIGDD